MAYNLMLVDAGFREPTLLHRMNVITGDYLSPININQTSLNVVATRIIETLIRDKPDKIIFDKFEIGYYLYEIFRLYLNTETYRNSIKVDAFGTITYH